MFRISAAFALLAVVFGSDSELYSILVDQKSGWETPYGHSCEIQYPVDQEPKVYLRRTYTFMESPSSASGVNWTGTFTWWSDAYCSKPTNGPRGAPSVSVGGDFIITGRSKFMGPDTYDAEFVMESGKREYDVISFVPYLLLGARPLDGSTPDTPAKRPTSFGPPFVAAGSYPPLTTQWWNAICGEWESECEEAVGGGYWIRRIHFGNHEYSYSQVHFDDNICTVQHPNWLPMQVSGQLSYVQGFDHGGILAGEKQPAFILPFDTKPVDFFDGFTSYGDINSHQVMMAVGVDRTAPSQVQAAGLLFLGYHEGSSLMTNSRQRPRSFSPALARVGECQARAFCEDFANYCQVLHTGTEGGNYEMPTDPWKFSFECYDYMAGLGQGAPYTSLESRRKESFNCKRWHLDAAMKVMEESGGTDDGGHCKHAQRVSENFCIDRQGEELYDKLLGWWGSSSVATTVRQTSWESPTCEIQHPVDQEPKVYFRRAYTFLESPGSASGVNWTGTFTWWSDASCSKPTNGPRGAPSVSVGGDFIITGRSKFMGPDTYDAKFVMGSQEPEYDVISYAGGRLLLGARPLDGSTPGTPAKRPTSFGPPLTRVTCNRTPPAFCIDPPTASPDPPTTSPTMSPTKNPAAHLSPANPAPRPTDETPTATAETTTAVVQSGASVAASTGVALAMLQFL